MFLKTVGQQLVCRSARFRRRIYSAYVRESERRGNDEQNRAFGLTKAEDYAEGDGRGQNDETDRARMRWPVIGRRGKGARPAHARLDASVSAAAWWGGGRGAGTDTEPREKTLEPVWLVRPVAASPDRHARAERKKKTAYARATYTRLRAHHLAGARLRVVRTRGATRCPFFIERRSRCAYSRHRVCARARATATGTG